MTHFCRLSYEQKAGEAQRNHEPPTTKPLSDAQKLRKVIMELVNTERQYNKVRNSTICTHPFLLPLKIISHLNAARSSRDWPTQRDSIMRWKKNSPLLLTPLSHPLTMNTITAPSHKNLWLRFSVRLNNYARLSRNWSIPRGSEI